MAAAAGPSRFPRPASSAAFVLAERRDLHPAAYRSTVTPGRTLTVCFVARSATALAAEPLGFVLDLNDAVGDECDREPTRALLPISIDPQDCLLSADLQEPLLDQHSAPKQKDLLAILGPSENAVGRELNGFGITRDSGRESKWFLSVHGSKGPAERKAAARVRTIGASANEPSRLPFPNHPQAGGARVPGGAGDYTGAKRGVKADLR